MALRRPWLALHGNARHRVKGMCQVGFALQSRLMRYKRGYAGPLGSLTKRA